MRLFRVVLAVAVLFVPSVLVGQGGAAAGVIQGRVVGESGQPLAAVNVAVRTAADSSVVGGEITNNSGQFRVQGLRPGRYFVTATLLGYSTGRAEGVEVTAGAPLVDVGSLRLVSRAIVLEGVVARGEASNVIVAPDRTIYSTRDMPVASGGMATDVLQGVPELLVDIDGNVELRGTAPQIYINGRPAPMEGESLQLFLQQFPADRIDRVEVISSPSARFEAEGAGGIVNIVLKENTSLGLSGNAFLNGGTRGNVGGGGNVTYQEGPLTLMGGSFVRVSSRDNTSYDFRENLLADPVTYLEQDGWSERDDLSGSINLSADYELTGSTSLMGEMRAFRRGNEQDQLTAYTHLDASRVPTDRYDRISGGERSGTSADFMVGLLHEFEPRRHELELEVEYELGGDADESVIRRAFFAPDGESAGIPDEFTYENEEEDESELSVQLDYVRPLGEDGQIEFGYRGDFQSSDNQRLLEVFASQDAAEPSTVTRSGFGQRERFNSGYLTLFRTFGPLGVQLGVRGEHAATRLDVPTGESFDNSYATIFPSGNLRYDLGGGRELRLGYSKRIRRPSSWVQNPINRSDDPLNRRVGNPEIDPVFNHNVSLEASWNGSVGTLRFAPYYRRSVGDWAEIKTVDENGVSTVTWENLNSVDSWGTSFTANLRPTRGFGGYVSVFGQRESRNAANLSEEFSGTSLNWGARANLQMRVNDDLNLQSMFFYSPAREIPQGSYSSTVRMDVGIRQQLLNDRISLNVSLRDPFDLYQREFITRDATHVQTGRSDFSMRSAVLSLSYTFGRPPRDQRDGDGPGEEGGMDGMGEEGGIR